MKVHQPLRSPGSGGGLRHRRQDAFLRVMNLRAMDLTVVDMLSTTVGGRIHTHRTNRRRAVFAYQVPCLPDDGGQDETPGNSWDVARSAAGARFARLRTHAPFNPVGGTMLRPVADAANTLNILRAIMRSPR